MDTNVTQYPSPVKTEGPFGVQGQQPDTGLMNRLNAGDVGRRIEREAAKLPSNTLMWAALGAVGASLLMRRKPAGLFRLVSPLLLFGLYNKMRGAHR